MNTTLSQNTNGLPVNQSIAFSDHKGVFKERLKKQQLNLMKPLETMLKQFLEPGEEILLAMRGCSPTSFLEQFTTGWIVYYLRQCALVVTDRRILHFPTRRNHLPRHSIAQVRFGDVDVIKPSTFRAKFEIRYKNGAKETFFHIGNLKKLKSVLGGIQFTGHQPTPYGVRHHLCPRCTTPLKVGEYLCPTCKLEFKNENKARFFSIVYPGGGYFYTRHPIIGIGDAIVETMLIVLFLVALFNVSKAVNTGAAAFAVFFFGIILFFEKLYTVYHAGHYVKEYIPVQKEIQPFVH